MNDDKEQRILENAESQAIIFRVYHYLKAEYEYTVSVRECNCDISHLTDIEQRTADAVGITRDTLHYILQQDLDIPKFQFKFSKVTHTVSKEKKKRSQTDTCHGEPQIKKEKEETEKVTQPEHHPVNSLTEVKQERIETEEIFIKDEVVEQDEDDDEEEEEEEVYIKEEYNSLPDTLLPTYSD